MACPEGNDGFCGGAKRGKGGERNNYGSVGAAYVDVANKELLIPLTGENGELIVKSGETATLAIYFAGNSARSTFSSAVIEYTYEEPAFTASVAENSLFTMPGTGKYENQKASGFFANITSNTDGAQATALSLSVNGVDKGKRDFETKITIDKGAGIYAAIAVSEEITDANAITMTVE